MGGSDGLAIFKSILHAAALAAILSGKDSFLVTVSQSDLG